MFFEIIQNSKLENIDNNKFQIRKNLFYLCAVSYFYKRTCL